MLVSSIHLVMIVTGFLLSMMFIVFVCTRLICARIQMNASTGPFPTASRSNVGRQEHGFHGLEPIFVATFPTKKFSDDFFSSGEDSQCTVCLAEYQERDILRILPYCGHFFHVSCIDTWLQQHSTCPVCRISLCDRKHQMQPMLSSVVRSYNMDSTDPYSYNWSITGHGYSSRTINNQSMVPAVEDQSASELDAAEIGESTSSAEDNNSQVGKDKDFHDSQTSMSRVHPLSINQ